ncbi:MAG: hypothetical protein LBP28_03020 [Coriobacteriales bacterium]|jgi:hypothetical protein|nr:hypothetical protein [Coriobacteriales bacterium]
MPEAFLQGLRDFLWLVVLAVPTGLLLLAVSLPLSADVNWMQKRLRFLGLFYNLTVREQLWLASGLVRVLFVAAIMFFWVPLAPSHISFYIALFVLSNALYLKLRRFFLDLLNAAVIFIAMVVSNLVSGYYWDVSGDVMLGSVCMLLALFVTMYVAYFYFKDACEMLENKAVKPPKATQGSGSASSPAPPLVAAPAPAAPPSSPPLVAAPEGGENRG